MRKTSAIPAHEIVHEMQKLYSQGQSWDGLRLAQEWLKTNESYEVRIEQLKALRHCSLVKDSLRLAESLSRLGPTNPIVGSIRGWATYCLRDKSLGKQILQAALLRYPWNARILNELAGIYVHEGNPQAAEEMLQKAVMEKPELSDLHLNLARFYSHRNQHEIAIEWANSSLMIRGAKLFNTFALGRAEIANRNPDIGLEIANELLANYPQANEGHLLTALALICLNRHGEALPWIKKCFHLAPNNNEVVEAWKATINHVNPYYSLLYISRVLISFLARRATHFGLRRITPYRPEAERQ